MSLRNLEQNYSTAPENQSISNKNKVIALIASIAAISGGVAFYEFQKNPSITESADKTIEETLETSTTSDNINTPTTEPTIDIATNTEPIIKKEVVKKPETTSVMANKPTTKYIGTTNTDGCPDPKAASCTLIYKDPCSGETVITTPNKTLEINGRKNNVIILGSSEFLELGITDVQIQKLWSDLSDYASSQKTPIKEIGVCVKTIDRINTDKETGVNSIDFTITVDRETDLDATIIYSGLSKMSLKISNPNNNQQIYSSVK